jgi:hypothetical protein
MRRYLLVALWPAGLAAITVATVIAARRAGTGDGAGRDGASQGRAARTAETWEAVPSSAQGTHHRRDEQAAVLS